MASGIWIIYRKELIDTLRDRKTLLFMLLIPTLAVPLMIGGMKKLVQNLEKKQALEVVRVAASDETHAAYRKLVHDWFLSTQFAAGLRVASSPMVSLLLKPEQRDALGEISPAIFTDPAAFEAWTRVMAGKARQGVDSDKDPDTELAEKVPDSVLDELLDFYRVTFKGLGLIEFVGTDQLPGSADMASAIKMRTVHGYMEISADPGGDGPIEITLIHDSTVRLSDEAYDRVAFVADRFGKHVVQERIRERNLGEHFLTPIEMRGDTDIASKSQKALSFIGGILPYFVIAFAFLGGMYPAIDLGAGEKERNTLETLILSPSSRTEIALGKFFVILTTSLTAAFLGLASIAISIQYIAPAALLQQLDLQIAPSTGLLVALLAVPPAAAFAGIFLAISIAARSFKEAQNYMAPLQFVLILPALAPMLPGMEMSWKMALIPLVNVSMLSKDFLKGDTNWGYYAVTLASCCAVAAACIIFAVRQFRREEVLFRS